MTRLPSLYLCVTLLSHFVIYSLFLSNTSCPSGLYMVINKLPLIDSLHWCGVKLRSANLCQHRGPLCSAFMWVHIHKTWRV